MWLSSLIRLQARLLIIAILGLGSYTLLAQDSGSPTSPIAPVPSREITSLQLGDGTSVRVRTTKTISSANARVGDEVRFRVADEIKVGGFVVIARDANAVGHVAAVEQKRRKGKPGSVTLAIDSVDLTTGALAPLRSSRTMKGRGENIAADAAELTLRTYGFGLPITPLLLLLKGEDVTVPRGAALIAFVNGNLPLREDELRRVQPAPPSTTGPATVFIYRLPVPPLVSRPTMYCGVVEIGTLAPGEYLSVKVEAGEYLFQSSGTKHQAKLQLEPAQTYYVLLSISMMFKGNLDVVSKAIGEDWVAVLEPSKAKAEVDLTAAGPDELHSTAKPQRPAPVAEYQEPPQ